MKLSDQVAVITGGANGIGAETALRMLAAAAIAVSSEAIVMGVKAGLDPKVMLDVINSGSGRNSATQDKFPRSILTGKFDYGFRTGLAYKDIRLCVNEAEVLGGQYAQAER